MYQTILHCVDFDCLAYLSIISQKLHGCDVAKATIQTSGNFFLEQWSFHRVFMICVGHKSENHSVITAGKDL